MLWYQYLCFGIAVPTIIISASFEGCNYQGGYLLCMHQLECSLASHPDLFSSMYMHYSLFPVHVRVIKCHNDYF